jgi:short-subunit dehydrogenase
MSEPRLVVVTGGSSGIGKEIARQLLRRGDRVVIVADQEQKLHVAERDLRDVSPNVWSVVCDIASPESVAAMGDAVLARFGCPDVLVNNAGFATYELFAQTAPEGIERLASVNFLGHLRVTRAFIGPMIDRRRGTIVNVASIAGRIPMAPSGVYSAAKHGMVAWSETLRHEIHRFGLRVVVVCPGRVPTHFFDHPTFQARRAGPETKQLISTELVAQVTLRAVDRGQFMVYLPSYYGLGVWLTQLLPFVWRSVLGFLIRRRVEEIYERESADLVGATTP